MLQRGSGGGGSGGAGGLLEGIGRLPKAACNMIKPHRSAWERGGEQSRSGVRAPVAQPVVQRLLALLLVHQRGAREALSSGNGVTKNPGCEQGLVAARVRTNAR